MKFGFIGVGVVGKAIYDAFSAVAPCAAYDKFKPEFSDVDGVLAADLVFVSVPTLTKPTREQALEPLIETCELLSNAMYQGVVVVKCTVVPGTTERLAKQYGLRMVHNPEFLTAKTPFEDFVHQKAIMIGGASADCAPVVKAYEALNAHFGNNAPIMCNDSPTVTEMSKYMHNMFLTLKVSFCNEVFEACEKVGVPYDSVREFATKVGQIGEGHTKVPGPDGKMGFGGMCFPKDSEAWLGFSKMIGVAFDTLEGAVNGNNRRRK